MSVIPSNPLLSYYVADVSMPDVGAAVLSPSAAAGRLPVILREALAASVMGQELHPAVPCRVQRVEGVRAKALRGPLHAGWTRELPAGILLQHGGQEEGVLW